MSRARRCPCHASCSRAASFGPTPSTSRRRKGSCSITSPSRMPNWPTSRLRQLLADALDPARAEIGDEPGLGGGRLERGGGGAELPAPAAVVVPGALGPDQLARARPAAACPPPPPAGARRRRDPQHAVAGLRPLEQHALDHAGERTVAAAALAAPGDRHRCARSPCCARALAGSRRPWKDAPARGHCSDGGGDARGRLAALARGRGEPRCRGSRR